MRKQDRSNTGVFQRLANIVHAADLECELGPAVPFHSSIPDAIEQIENAAASQRYNPMGRTSLVVRESDVLGAIRLDVLLTAESTSVTQAMHKISPSQIIASNMPAIYAADLICKSNYDQFFVLHGNEINGTLSYPDLYASPFRLCLFGLTLQLEEAALAALSVDAQGAIDSLNASRQDKAIAVCLTRYGESQKENASVLLKCTTFIDKSKMLTRTKLIDQLTKAQVTQIFNRAEVIRNYCAHPDGEERGGMVVERSQLAEFIDNTMLLLRSFAP